MYDLSVVIPVLDEDHSIIDNLVTELKSIGAEVVVVDDGSNNPYPNSIKHGVNFGYGSALMTGIKNASRDLVLTMDGDSQHTVSEAVKLYHAFKLIGNADMVIGARQAQNEAVHRWIGRKLLNWFASIICLFYLRDLNSGMRIFRRSIAISYFSILCRTFSFTTSLTISMLCDKYKVEFFPIDVKERSYGKSKVRVFKHGLVTLYYILRNGLALRTRGIRLSLRKIPLWNFLTKKGFKSLP